MKSLLIISILIVSGCGRYDSSRKQYEEFTTICVYGHSYFVGPYGNTVTSPVYDNSGSLVNCSKSRGTVIVPNVD